MSFASDKRTPFYKGKFYFRDKVGVSGCNFGSHSKNFRPVRFTLKRIDLIGKL